MGRLCGAQGLAARFPGRKPLAFSFSAAYRLHTGWPTPSALPFLRHKRFFGQSFYLFFFSRGKVCLFAKGRAVPSGVMGPQGRFSLRPVWRNYERYGKKDPRCRVRQHQ